MKPMVEFRWHGRGGQGAWTASNLLAIAALHEGKYIQSFPEFGGERGGAPIMAYTRISKEPIRLHCSIEEPDVVVVLDNTLLKTVPVASGINQDNGIIVINSIYSSAKMRKVLNVENTTVRTIPATEIALRILGIPIMNTALLGAVAKATNIVTLEGIEKAVKERFNSALADKNFAVIKEAYENAKSELDT